MKRFIMAASAAIAAIGCSADIDPESIRVAEYKDGKKCAVSLTFDDGMKEHYTIVAPELEKRGFRGTFWLCSAWIHDDPQTDTTHVTWTEVIKMDERGHEMSNHSWSHPNLTELSEEALIEEIRRNDDAIAEHIGSRPVTFCFPYNAYNEHTVAIAMEGRVGARLKEFWLGGQHSPMDYLHKQIEDALAGGTWIAGMTHGINYGYDCYEDPGEFTDFLDYLREQEGDIWIGTFRDVARYTKAAKSVRLTVEKKGNSLSVTPELDLDKDLYATLLTMEISSGNTGIKAEQDGKTLEVTSHDGKSFFSFDPFGGCIIIR